MKLIFLYGPPAAGKLTVATGLAKLTGYKVFDNHKTIDLTKDIFGDHDMRLKLVERLRLGIIEAAAQADIDLIFTYVFNPGDEVFIDEVVRAVEKHSGTVGFVRLIPNEATLAKRVEEASRKAHTKIQTADVLKKVLDKYDLYAPISNRESLTIDNTSLSAEEVARQIVEHFGLNAV